MEFSNVPVDQGWAWMVCLGAFLNMFVTVGTLKSALGLVVAELLKTYGESAAYTMQVYSIIGGIGIFMSPVATTVGDLFTHRAVCMIGAVMTCLGPLIACFATTLPGVIYPYGIFTGLGVSMLLTPGPVMIAKYFDQKRARANGLFFSGTGIGGMVMPLLIHYLLDEYGINQCLMLMAGIHLHCCAHSALFRPTSFYTNRIVRSHDQQLLLLDDKHAKPLFNGDTDSTTVINGNTKKLVDTTTKSAGDSEAVLSDDFINQRVRSHTLDKHMSGRPRNAQLERLIISEDNDAIKASSWHSVHFPNDVEDSKEKLYLSARNLATISVQVNVF